MNYKKMTYTVFGVGGENDGKEILVTDDLADAINAAYAHTDEFPLGTAIIDQDGKDVEW